MRLWATISIHIIHKGNEYTYVCKNNNKGLRKHSFHFLYNHFFFLSEIYNDVDTTKYKYTCKLAGIFKINSKKLNKLY